MTKFLGLLTCCAASALMAVSTAAEEPSKIYACKDARGNVVYQGEPCVEPPPATSPAPAAPTPPAKPKPYAMGKPSASSQPPAKPHPPAKKAPPPPNGAAQESVVRAFVSAVKTGDRSAALSCLTSTALAQLGPSAEALPIDALRKTVDAFTGYVSEGDLGPYWSIRALRADPSQVDISQKDSPR